MATNNAPKVTMWYLPKDVDYVLWNVRSNHRRAASVVDTIKAGEIFFVSDMYESRNGEKWLKVVQIGMFFFVCVCMCILSSVDILHTHTHTGNRSCNEGWCNVTEGILRPVGDLQDDAIAGINYVLPKFLSYDSWNVRASPKSTSRVISVIKAGEPFLVTKRVQPRGTSAEWLKLDRGGWCQNLRGMLRPVVGGQTLFQPLEVSSTSSRRSERLRRRHHDHDEKPPVLPPTLKKFKSMTARRAFEAVTELRNCRETLQRIQEMYVVCTHTHLISIHN